MRLMISQPMIGKTNEQIREERRQLVEQLEAEGHEVVDSVFTDEAPEGNAAIYFLSKAIEAMSTVDGVVFMPGWSNARGCVVEYNIASQYGLFIKTLNN